MLRILFSFAVLFNVMVAESVEFKENRDLYKGQKSEMKFMYVTILPNAEEHQGKKLTFEDVTSDVNWNDENEPEMPVIFQEGDKNGPKENLYGYGEKNANGIIKRRGHSSREAVQPSFKINLNKDSKLYYGQRTINLNKHPFDSIRMRNKLSFDFFQEIPHIPSLLTNFVHLYIKDIGKENQSFVDYGLFTEIENPDKYYLKNHGLDENGNLYKAEYFEFQRYPEIIKLKTDKGYNKREFEKLLEIKGSESHEKLIRMLDDVNNMNLDIDQVIEKHFNKNNYIAWLAANMLMENMDTDAQNFFLYSSKTSDTWYFIPWDFDGSWGFYETPNISFPLEQWKSYPITNYWNDTLHRRFFLKSGNIDALSKKMEEMVKNNLNKDRIIERLHQYKSIIQEVYLNLPDSLNNDFLNINGVSKLEDEYRRIADVPSKKMELLKKSLKLPMPFFIGIPENRKNDIRFVWSSSYSFDRQQINYSLIVSDRPDMKKVILKAQKLTKTEFVTKKLKPGKYYIKVVAEKSDGNTMEAFDGIYDDPSGKNYYGIKSFEITK